MFPKILKYLSGHSEVPFSVNAKSCEVFVFVFTFFSTKALHQTLIKSKYASAFRNYEKIK